MTHLLWMMYVDDGDIVDFITAKGTGQQAIEHLFELLGAPLSPDKKTPMDTKADFLGITHDFRAIASEGVVRFWPRDQVCKNIRTMLQAFKKIEACSHVEASKFNGAHSFCGLAVFWARR